MQQMFKFGDAMSISQNKRRNGCISGVSAVNGVANLLDMSEVQARSRHASNCGLLIIKSVNEHSAGFSDFPEHRPCQKTEPYHWWLSA